MNSSLYLYYAIQDTLFLNLQRGLIDEMKILRTYIRVKTKIINELDKIIIIKKMFLQDNNPRIVYFCES